MSLLASRAKSKPEAVLPAPGIEKQPAILGLAICDHEWMFVCIRDTCQVPEWPNMKGPTMARYTRVSHVLTFDEAVEVHKMIRAGVIQSRIAAHFDVNGGRISEVNKGLLHPGSYEAAFGKKVA